MADPFGFKKVRPLLLCKFSQAAMDVSIDISWSGSVVINDNHDTVRFMKTFKMHLVQNLRYHWSISVVCEHQVRSTNNYVTSSARAGAVSAENFLNDGFTHINFPIFFIFLNIM